MKTTHTEQDPPSVEYAVEYLNFEFYDPEKGIGDHWTVYDRETDPDAVLPDLAIFKTLPEAEAFEDTLHKTITNTRIVEITRRVVVRSVAEVL